MLKIPIRFTIAMIIGGCLITIMMLIVAITLSDHHKSKNILYSGNNSLTIGILHQKNKFRILDRDPQKVDTFNETKRDNKYPSVKYAGHNVTHSQINTILPWITHNKLIIVVLSARNDFKIRSVIRETWAKNHDNVFFVIGKPCFIPEIYRKRYTCTLQNTYTQQISTEWNNSVRKSQELILRENNRFHDIIYVNTVDVYRYLPQKLKAAYQWVVENTDAQWILKIDVDCVVRVTSLEKYLLSHFDAQRLNIIAAGININSRVTRSGKWAEYPEFGNTTYPPWPNGAGHVVSRPIARYISENQNSLFNAQGEDVSLGIWMHGAPFQKSITWVASDKFISHAGDCRNSNALVIGHQISPLAMKQCFDFMDETIYNTHPQNISINRTMGGLDSQIVEFVHITKTGGSLIEKAAAKHGIRWGACHFYNDMYKKMGCPGFPDLEGKISLTKFSGSSEWHVPFMFWKPNVFRHATTFTVVRNPYDRAVSEYYNVWGGYTGPNSDDPDTMNTWIQNMIHNPKGIRYLPQYHYVFHGNYKIVDYVIHFENLEEEFNTLMMKFNLPVRLGQEKFNARRPGTRLSVYNLSRSTCHLIENFARRDFESFGYSFLRFN